MKHTTAILFTVVLGLVSSVSMASTFRCGSQVVSTGERAFKCYANAANPSTAPTSATSWTPTHMATPTNCAWKNGSTALKVACTTTYALKAATSATSPAAAKLAIPVQEKTMPSTCTGQFHNKIAQFHAARSPQRDNTPLNILSKLN